MRDTGEIPLVIPFLVGAAIPSESADHALPVTPSHIAHWTRSSDAGPSRHTAIAGEDNTVWVVSSYPSSFRTPNTPRHQELHGTDTDIPIIQTPLLSPGSSRRTRPPQSRNLSYSNRPRATSSASSVVGSSTSKRRISAFSPPPSARQLPTTTLSQATASVAPPDTHAHRTSISERAELRGHLREQKDRKDEGTGLGLGGVGRRGLQGVHGKEENQESSGAASPKSSMSVSTESTVGRFGFWRHSSASIDGVRDLQDQMEEIEVERAMEKERKEGQKEKEDLKLVEEAMDRSPTPGATFNFQQTHADVHGCDWEDKQVVRVVLRSPGTGKVVELKVLEELDTLCVLRDQGLLDIFSLATLDCTASIDLESPEDTPGSKPGLRIPHFWSWRGVHLAKKEDTFLLFAHGLPWPCALPSPNGEVTRVVGLGPSHDLHEGLEIVARLELPGEGDVGICRNGDTNYLIHATPSSLTSYPVIFPPVHTPSPSPQLRATPQQRATSSAYPSPAHLRAPTPEISHSKESAASALRKSASAHDLSERGDKHEKGFAKFLAARRADWSRKGKEDEKVEEVVPGLGEGSEVERDGYGHWKRIVLDVTGEGVGWGDDSVDMFQCDGKTMWVKGSVVAGGKEAVRAVTFSRGWNEVVVLNEGGLIALYEPIAPTDESRKTGRLRFKQTFGLEGVTSIFLESGRHLLLSQPESIKLLDLGRRDRTPDVCLALATTHGEKQSALSHIVPYGVEQAYIADPQGNVYRRGLDSVLTTDSPTVPSDEPDVDRLEASVTCMKLIRDPSEGGKRFLVVGDEDGVVRIWTADTFKFCGSWTLFAWPVHSFTLIDVPQAGHLQGHLLCTSEAGTIGILSLRDMEQLFLIPASRTPLRRIFVENTDILIAYANGKARVWNTKTQEFRRSTGLDASEDMLQAGDWAEVDLKEHHGSKALSSSTNCSRSGSELGRLLDLDLREVGRWLHSSKNNPNHSPLPALRTLLSVVLTFGINDTVDETCTSKLGIHRPTKPIVIGQGSSERAYAITYATGVEAWRVSHAMTGLRQLAIITLLRPFLDSPDHERYAAEVIAFYTASLPSNIIEPDLEFFASYYMDPSTDVHQAARMLFAARVGRLSEAEIEDVTQSRESGLPSHQTGASRLSAVAANTLCLLGGIALQRYQLINPSVLKALSESVALYLHEPRCTHLPLAIELCSKGFANWQTYVDPSDLLRRLFHLATNKEPPSMSSTSSTSIAAQSRLAVLHVASANAPLFMSTLSMDILDSRTAESRSSIMKLCVFMARKKPAVLENGLPRIAEAVVKSLDPNVGKMRDDVWQAATVILHELVLAFSTIDFHSGTQRLAVGTHEGAVIMYDLKTASRLYVLEPHKHPVSAVTFSPDGRRLITVSLEEGSVTVWKVGSSLSGFFNVGGPPRQGAEKGEPFKRIEFMRADDGPLESTTALSDVQVTWPGARQAKVMIKETALTFET
ncbi:hypothetical protein IAT38_001488 [Cryptococcus sp. DSM 104549]